MAKTRLKPRFDLGLAFQQSSLSIIFGWSEDGPADGTEFRAKSSSYAGFGPPWEPPLGPSSSVPASAATAWWRFSLSRWPQPSGWESGALISGAISGKR